MSANQVGIKIFNDSRREKILKLCSRSIETGIIFLVIFTPLAFGSVHIWAYTLMELTVILLLSVWLIKLMVTGCRMQDADFDSTSLNNPENFQLSTYNSQLVKTPLNLPLFLFLCLILFQMLPLPPSVIKHLSPNTYRLYQQTLPGYDLENRKSPSGCKFNFLKSPHHSFTQSWKSLSIYRHATRTEFLKILAYIGIFFLIINNIKTRRQVNRLILCIILVGCFEAFYGLLEYLSGHQHIFFIKKKYYNDCVTGTYINRNHLAGYLGMVIPVAFGLLIARSLNYSFIHTGSWRHRLSGIESYLSKNSLIIFAAIVMILTLIFSQSRMGIFSLLCSLSFMSLVIIASSRERRKRTFISISTLVIILVLWGSWIGLNPVVERFSSVFREWASEGGRPVIWKDTVNLVKDFPALGTGLGTYIYIFPKYKTIRARLLYDHAHNDYLEYLSEIGIIGILIMLAGIALFIIKIIKRWQKRRDAYVRGMTLGGLTGIVAIILHSAADFNLHIPANALLLAIIMGLTFNMVNLKSAGRRRVTE